MRSDSSTPPGSRRSSTGSPRAASAAASRSASVVFPAPSSPSIVISRPRMAIPSQSHMSLPGTERHPHARAVLGGALPPEGRPSHAYLFHGPAGAGKRAVARAFAAALLADGADDPAEVAERVARGTHPDLGWVTPSGAAEMLVADIDEPVVAAATRTPFDARRRLL